MFDFLMVPNATHGGMHIGHMFVWSFVRAEYLRLMQNAMVNEWPDKPQWVMIFDHASRPECEEAYLRTLNWLGWMPDKIIRMNDYHKVSSAPWHYRCKIPPASKSKHLALLLMMQQTPHHWRGGELTGINLVERELAGIYNLSLPEPHYVCMLCSQPFNEVINTTRGVGYIAAGKPYPYIITKEHYGLKPMEVLKRIWSFVATDRLPSIPKTPWLPELNAQNITSIPERMVEEWKTLSRWPMETPFNGPTVVIPPNWADGLPTKA